MNQVHNTGKGAVVVLSGGQDSTTCLFIALEDYGGDIHCVTYDYGQRHQRELEAASSVVSFAREKYPERTITHTIVTVGPILEGTSPLVSDAELEQYEDHDSLPGGLEKTFVPMRNQLFLTLAANFAFVRGVDTIFTGVCQADSGGYPDCRRAFVEALEYTSSVGTFNQETGFPRGLQIATPLMYLTKAESVSLALSIPYAYAALAFTHTAYDGAYPPVGKDHATLLRAKGFAEAGVPDPLVLRAVREGLMEMPQLDGYHSDQVMRVQPMLSDA